VQPAVSIKEKRLGSTDLTVPEIGFGTWDYHGGTEPLRKAVSLGAVLIDTAESYGTEEVVGAAIKGIRQRALVATKVSPRNFRYRDVLLAADRSLKRLQTDYIDIYQLHWPNYTVSIEETMAAMEDLVTAGKIRFIGVSRFCGSDLKRAQAALRNHKIVSNQVRYSLIDRTCDPELLAYCQQEQITVIAFSPLGQNFATFKSHDPDDVLWQIALTIGKTRAQVALNWCIVKSGVIAIPKATSVAHIVEDYGASGWQLSSEHIALLDRGIKFDKRTPLEMGFRRLVQHCVQRIGRNLDLVSPVRTQTIGKAAMPAGV
jgi:diketogulonate reductase-like aldo/keto reductase